MKKALTTILILWLCQSCVFEHSPDLQVTIINNTKSDFLIDEYECCDTNIAGRNIRWFCEPDSEFDGTSYPKIIKSGQTGIMNTRMKAAESILVINADSLRANCRSAGLTAESSWMQILSQDVDAAEKRCTIIIK
ncbi:hypothetical protein IDJ77_26945 [Mucilaginibacter sp. ZT4R22]|uniref:Lipoprotein n=1 Tax=Mucilaginibacter pankratovii TaxID=2772110 RepID=A0ABR7X0M3_9SPHI|nr:hypothetical protein [Mucilaginibacter pankratovii]MBD1367477.1 hypothetical protein [Mucilaginibacter pankratovii]